MDDSKWVLQFSSKYSGNLSTILWNEPAMRRPPKHSAFRISDLKPLSSISIDFQFFLV